MTGHDTNRQLQLTALRGIPLVAGGDDLTAIILHGVEVSGLALQPGDALVIAQKIVSKAERRSVALAEVTPSVRALELAARTDKDPRLIELILRESNEVVRARQGVIIVEQRCGVVMANADIDASNVGGDDAQVLLLPEDADATCARLRAEIAERTGCAVAVLINDSIGRAWRNGTVGTALGSAGLHALYDARGRRDLFGRELRATEIGAADEIAAAASILMGAADEARPVVHVRGLPTEWLGSGTAGDLIRARERDLFR